MARIRSLAHYAIGLLAVALLALNTPFVHASPNPQPGVGQVGDNPFCVQITGNTQGDFGTESPSCGTPNPNGLEGTFFDIAFKAGQTSGGKATPPTFGRVTFRHPKGAASIRLLRALATNEGLSHVRFNFLHVDQSTPYFSIQLENARVQSINEYLPDTQSSSSAGSVPLTEEVTLSYTGISESSGGLSFSHKFVSST